MPPVSRRSASYKGRRREPSIACGVNVPIVVVPCPQIIPRVLHDAQHELPVSHTQARGRASANASRALANEREVRKRVFRSFQEPPTELSRLESPSSESESLLLVSYATIDLAESEYTPSSGTYTRPSTCPYPRARRIGRGIEQEEREEPRCSRLFLVSSRVVSFAILVPLLCFTSPHALRRACVCERDRERPCERTTGSLYLSSPVHLYSPYCQHVEFRGN